MKNTVTIALEDKKVLALKMYLGQKNSSLEEEVSRFAEQLYVKSVPQNVRDFIDMEAKQQSDLKPKNVVAKQTAPLDRFVGGCGAACAILVQRYICASKSVNYISPLLTSMLDSVVINSEQRISRNLFKIAVELGKLSHMIAAANEVDDDTVKELHKMCVDEVRHINGLISFESAVKFQQED